MPGNHARVPNRANDNQTLADGALDQFAQRTIQIRLFKVAAAEMLTTRILYSSCFQNHSGPRCIVHRDATVRPTLLEHFGVGRMRDKPFWCAVSGGNDRGHHPCQLANQ